MLAVRPSALPRPLSALGATALLLTFLAAVGLPAAHAGMTEVYRDGRLTPANVKEMPENWGRGRDRDLPALYAYFWDCEFGPDSTYSICMGVFNPVFVEEADPPFYRGVDVWFLPGTGGRLLTSVEEIEEAVEQGGGGVVLEPTERVYRCKLMERAGDKSSPTALASDLPVRHTTWGRLKSLYR